MRKFYILPDGGKWREVEAATAEIAYSSISCWYGSETRIAIIDAESKEADIFTNTLDDSGNLIKINKLL